jgi:pentatricopeptide repeat protein
LDGFVNRDGCTSLENYERAKAMFDELREEGLKQFTGQELADFEEQSRWVVGKDRV